jgi:hypothetical protein
MAFATGRKGLPSDEGDLMRQAMLRVKYPINSAFRDDGRALEELCHKSVRFEQMAVHGTYWLSMQFLLPKWYHILNVIKRGAALPSDRVRSSGTKMRQTLEPCKQVHFGPSFRHYQTYKLRNCSVKSLLPELKIG